MKRILFVSTGDFNKFGGGSQAIRAYLDSVLDIFGADRVDIMIGSEFTLLDDYKRCSCIKIPKRSRLESYIGLFKGHIERWTGAILNHLKQHSAKYETIIINSSRSGIIYPQITEMGIKILTIHHNDEVEYCMDNKTVDTFGGRISYFVDRAQRIAYQYSDINVFLTNQDLDRFRTIYGDNNKINKVLGVYDYKSALIKTPQSRPYSYEIGISGSLCDYQTIHGITDLNDNYLDIIKTEIPDYKILITGRNPSEHILRMERDKPTHIRIIPNPIDIHKELEACSIFLCPTCIGGGLKLRVMDGLKLGMPILVHQISARGYDEFISKPYFKVYRDRESFESGLTELLEYIKTADIHARHKISRDYYSYFGYSAGTMRFRSIYSLL